MSIYNLYETDKKSEFDGVLVPVGKDKTGRDTLVRIARAGPSNPRYQRVLESKTKKYRRLIQNDLLDTSVADGVMMEVFAETVVLGWENMEDRDGNVLPYSRENCLRLFQELPDFFYDIREQATKSALFRREALEKEAGN